MVRHNQLVTWQLAVELLSSKEPKEKEEKECKEQKKEEEEPKFKEKESNREDAKCYLRKNYEQVWEYYSDEC